MNNYEYIDMSIFFKIAREKLAIILLIFVLFLTSGIASFFIMDPEYKAISLVQVSKRMDFNDSGVTQNSIFNLLANDKNDERRFFITEFMNSRAFFYEFFLKKERLFKANSDISRNLLSHQETKSIEMLNRYDLFNSGNVQFHNSIEEEYSKFIEKFSIIIDPASGFLQLSYLSHSPESARMILGDIITEANSKIRNYDLKIIEQSIDYLNNYPKSDLRSEIVSSVNNLLETMLTQKMLAEVNTEYAITVIDDPFASSEAVNPNLFRMLLFSLIGGLLLTGLYILLIYISRSSAK